MQLSLTVLGQAVVFVLEPAFHQPRTSEPALQWQEASKHTGSIETSFKVSDLGVVPSNVWQFFF